MDKKNVVEELVRVAKAIVAEKMELRRVDDVQKLDIHTTIMDYPIVVKGTREEVEEYAKKKNLKWKKDRSFLFGGYWVDSKGTSYLPT